MGTTRDDLRRWFEHGKEQGATHMLVVCDTFDWDDYPVYVLPDQDVQEVRKQYSKDMQKIMECYSYTLPINRQLAEHRAFHWD